MRISEVPVELCCTESPLPWSPSVSAQARNGRRNTRSGVSSRPAASTRPADAGDGVVCARSGGPDTTSAAAASRADGAASWPRGCDDDEASCVCGCDRGPSRARGAVRECCTRCSAGCCESPARCPPGQARLPGGTCCSSDGAPSRRTTYSHLAPARELLIAKLKRNYVTTRGVRGTIVKCERKRVRLMKSFVQTI